MSDAPKSLLLATLVLASLTSAAVSAAAVTLAQARAPPTSAKKTAPKRTVTIDASPASDAEDDAKAEDNVAPAKSDAESDAESDSDDDGNGGRVNDEWQHDVGVEDFEDDNAMGRASYGEHGRSQLADQYAEPGYGEESDEDEDADTAAKAEQEAKLKVPASKLKFKAYDEVWSQGEYRWVRIKRRAQTSTDARLAFTVHRRLVAPGGGGGDPIAKVYARILHPALTKVLQVTMPPDERLYEKTPFLNVGTVYAGRGLLVAFVDAGEAWLGATAGEEEAKDSKDDEEADTKAAASFAAATDAALQRATPKGAQWRAPTKSNRLTTLAEIRTGTRAARLLLDFLDAEYAETVAAYAALKAEGLVSYEHLWLLLQVGAMLAYTHPVYRRATALRCKSVRYVVPNGDETPYFLVQGEMLEWSGKRLFRTVVKRAVPAYAGPKPIAELPLLPLETLPADARADLVARGKMFTALAGTHYREYDGPMYVRDCQGRVMALGVTSRIMIDRANMAKFQPGYPMIQPPTVTLDNQGINEADVEGEWLQEQEFTDEDYMTCMPIVYGFCLSKKIWGEFVVDLVKDISFVEDAYEQLVLPANTKQLISGLVASHDAKRMVGDMIRGKGQGLIFLLHGAPGNGKTLTAEAISETLRRPLYALGVGELGSTPGDVEERLQGALDLAEAWDAVLLLDEADVFLEQRSAHELERNGIIAIFLRLLEYYGGIMFLTTNRVSSFDAAFHSRISLALRYNDLDHDARTQVWNQVLDRIEALDAARYPGSSWRADIDVAELAAIPLNGRVIKSSLRTAHAMAAHQGRPLAMADVRTVLHISNEFHRSLKGDKYGSTQAAAVAAAADVKVNGRVH